jgi:hypothetical protein
VIRREEQAVKSVGRLEILERCPRLISLLGENLSGTAVALRPSRDAYDARGERTHDHRLRLASPRK